MWRILCLRMCVLEDMLVHLNVLAVLLICLSSLFALQSSYPVWEDFCAKATKLHSQLR